MHVKTIPLTVMKTTDLGAKDSVDAGRPVKQVRGDDISDKGCDSEDAGKWAVL